MGTELHRDERVLDAPPDELGWVGRDRASDEVEALRAHLEANNGMQGLEVVRPDQVAEAARLFRRDGFVVVVDALSPRQLDQLREAALREARQILALDRNRIGNRGSHRYSFGSASKTRHLLHLPEWTMLIDLPTVTPILCEIFGSDEYQLRGGGGDFCLPGATRYQPLHSDTGDRREYTTRGGRLVQIGSFHDPTGRLSVTDLPVSSIACNFLTTDFTRLNGPTRQIPGTQNRREPIPTLDEEPEWMRLSTVCPAPAGSVLIRDVRAWHGGTPNLSDELRAIPNAEFWAPWYRETSKICMPREVWSGLSDHARSISRSLVAFDEELDLGYRDDIGR